jgi:pimeloyl-ACP methyl ester carboxylesterase
MPDSMPAIAADLIAFVKALDLKEIDLFAFSIGGMIAQQFVLAAPGLVRRILLVGTGPSGGEGMQEFSREVMDIVNRPNSTIQGRTLDLFFSKSPASYAAGNAWLERIAARKLDREPETGPQVAEAQLVALAKWGVIPATDRYGDLKKIKQRTLVVNGKDDMMVPTINSYILQQHLPDARLILYPDSGHGSHFQFPECSPKGPHVSSPLLEPKGAAVSTATVCAAYSARGIDGERSAVGRARRFGDLRVSRHNGTRRRDAGRPREGPLCH